MKQFIARYDVLVGTYLFFAMLLLAIIPVSVYGFTRESSSLSLGILLAGFLIINGVFYLGVHFRRGDSRD